VVQLPRLGLLGTSDFLLLGLPVMQALSKQDLVAVLAHESGHLSGNHGRFSGWVYRVVRSYVRVLETTGSNKILEKLLDWYVPRLDALSFPLRRQNEYEADAVSAEVVGKQRAGQALTNVHVRASVQQEFWKAVNRRVFRTPHPPAELFVDWEKRIQSQPE
jgi:Zn-dependent protease with chaperone function